jgi:hypothetical protein
MIRLQDFWGVDHKSKFFVDQVSGHTGGAKTLRIMTFSIMTFSIMTLSIMTLSVMKLSILYVECQ